MITKTLLTLTFAASLLKAQAAEFDHNHAEFTKILKGVVQNERVNYTKLKQDPDPLGAYIDSLGAVSASQFSAWSEEQRLAFLINLYNASTLKLVTDHYPVESIKNIGTLLQKTWDIEVVPFLGTKVSLNHIEHKQIRANYTDPRTHFALVCASIGCPPLRSEAFAASRLSAQLDEQGKAFLRSESKNRVDVKNGTLYLSPIFQWFEADFIKTSGSIAKFVAPYFSFADEKAILSEKLKIEYTDYNWSLNKL
jgi:hypothetical protein